MKYSEILGLEAPVSERRKKTETPSTIFAGNTDRQILAQPGLPRETAQKQAEFTTFNIITLLVIATLIVTAYISNVITVDSLMAEATKLEQTESKLIQERENLRADINMLTSYNRIQKIATEKLGLVHATQQPYTLELSEE